jgi:hypothetical protein
MARIYKLDARMRALGDTDSTDPGGHTLLSDIADISILIPNRRP